MPNLILVRHGQSEWNLENRFTGWTDVALTPQGILEAEHAGELLLRAGVTYDISYTSLLKRAIRTLHILAQSADELYIQEYRTWRLNERHYGALQGLNKTETAKKYGEEQVKIWRRSYDVRPPLLSPDDPRAPRFDPKYRTMDWRTLPLGESLKDTIERVLPIWTDHIAEDLKSGKNVLVVAHGNSLRGLIKFIKNISDEDIVNLEIPTGVPYIYQVDSSLNILDNLVLK